MESLKAYLTSVVAVSMFCAIINLLVKQKGTVSPLLKLMSGIVIMIAVLRPVVQFRIIDIYDYIDSFSDEASYHVQTGEKSFQEAQSAIIKDKTESYILDKATSLDADIAVEVIVAENAPYVPIAVYLRGAVSPYAKKQLSDYIAETLAIGKEAQIWTG